MTLDLQALDGPRGAVAGMVDGQDVPVGFHRPFVGTRAVEYVVDCVSGGRLAGDGTYSMRAAQHLREWVGPGHVLLTPSCTAALELAMITAGIGPGDEVIVPSFAFSSNLTSILSVGATPVIADVDDLSLNLSAADLARRITPRTRAVVALHYAGLAVAPEVTAWCRERGVLLIEDAAHALGAFQGAEPVGSIGDLAAFSFHETKNLQCGEGGALVVNDASLLERALMARSFGTDRGLPGAGRRGYEPMVKGSSYFLSDALAAVLLAGLEEYGVVLERRRSVCRRYAESLGRWAQRNSTALDSAAGDDRHAAHIFFLLLPSKSEALRLIGHLRFHGVDVRQHYRPLHTSPLARSEGVIAGAECPVALRAADRIVRLPVHQELSDSDIDHVIQAVEQFAVRSV